LEKGKDVIFSVSGGFGNTEHCACVVKNSPITADHTKRQRISDVLGQVRQALCSPFLDANAREAFVTKCFIICPHEISQVTLAIIKEELHELGERIDVIDGPKLFSLLQEHYPDYKAAEFEAVVATAREQVRHDEPLERLAFATLQTDASRDAHLIYVKPSFEIILREWSVRSTALLQDITPSLPDPVRARDEDRKKTELYRTNVYSIPADYTVRLRTARGGFSKRVEIFASVRLLDKDIIDGVLAAYDEVAKCLGSTSTYGPTSELLRSLKAEYGDRLILPTQDFLLMRHDDVIKLTAAITVLREALSGVVRGVDKELTESVRGGSSLEGEGLSRAMYLSDLFHYRPTPYVAERQTMRIAVQEDSLHRSGQSAFIVGPAGYGKTSFCRWHTLEDDKLFSGGSHDWVAVYVPLHRLSQEEVSSLTVAIGKQAAYVSGLFSRRERRRAIGYRVYLDGLDEVDDENARSKIIAFVKARKQLGAPTEYVLTARDYLVSAETEGIPRFYICPLSDAQLAALAGMWLDGAARATDFLRQLDENPALKDLSRIPLLCTLTILVYRKTSTLPENRLKLYEAFVELLCSGWDLAKGLQRRSKLKSEFKALILRKLALLAHSERKKAFRGRDLNLVISRLDLRFSEGEIEMVLEELIADGLIHRSGEAFEFRHLSLQEYLAALEMFSEPSKEAANGCLALFLDGDLWWRDVMEFYVLLIRDPIATVRWIEQQMRLQKLTSTTAAAGCAHLRGLVRKCLPVDDRQLLLRPVRTCL
jgi:hypothetical protein